MEAKLHVDILPQPDDTTCGPTCLHAVYRYYGDHLPLPEVIGQVRTLAHGGTLTVMLGLHALGRGYDARIYTYNLHLFDPTWFGRGGVDLAERLQRQLQAKPDPKLVFATEGYLEFLRRGGEVRFEDLTGRLMRRYLDRGAPLITGLSSTYLYHTPREMPQHGVPDDVAGLPTGHFVVLAGYDRPSRAVLIADPYADNPVAADHLYVVPIDRVVGSILLGVLTYDATLLIVQPRATRRAAKARAEGDARPRPTV